MVYALYRFFDSLQVGPTELDPNIYLSTCISGRTKNKISVTMATVGVTHYAQLPGSRKLMPTRKSGTEFLVASHFTIAQDSEVTSPSLKSIFKKDYTPWHIACRPPASEPPPPAEVLHKDDRFFAEKASETSKAYKFRGANLPRPDMSDVSAKLRTTNFKMDRDVSKFDSFHTSHNLDFYAKEFQGVPKSMPKENPMESFIPQGDPEKAQHPQSDYRDRFRGHDALTTKPEKALSMHQGRATFVEHVVL